MNRIAGIVGGLYFLGLFIYLFFTAFLPITTSGSWRGIGDIIAITSYLLGVIPLMGMALIDMGILARERSERAKLKLHMIFVAIFLVVAHVAMIFGMVNPSVFGYHEPMNTMNHQMTETTDHMSMSMNDMSSMLE